MANIVDINTISAEENKIMTSEKIREIEEKDSLGIPLKRHEKIWFNNQVGIRKVGISFAMTNEEVLEYAKCKLSVHYFAEGHCKIKRQDGTIGRMKLRDYQRKIIDLYVQNRFSILMASRQTGKCLNFNTVVDIKDETSGLVFKVSIGELYYKYIKKERKLTWKEDIKYTLYKVLSRLEK